MLKYYDDAEKAGQTGEWRTLVYEGMVSGNAIKGKWFYEGFEDSLAYSGTFRIS